MTEQKSSANHVPESAERIWDSTEIAKGAIAHERSRVWRRELYTKIKLNVMLALTAVGSILTLLFLPSLILYLMTSGVWSLVFFFTTIIPIAFFYGGMTQVSNRIEALINKFNRDVEFLSDLRPDSPMLEYRLRAIHTLDLEYKDFKKLYDILKQTPYNPKATPRLLKHLRERFAPI